MYISITLFIVSLFVVEDADRDDIRCRWASGSECDGVCETFSPGTLNGVTL